MDQPVHDPGMEGRVERLERDITDVKAVLGRLEPMVVSIHAQMPHLATKAEMERMRAELDTRIIEFRGEVLVALAQKPGYGAMWAMGIALFTLTLTGLATGAFYLPLMSRLLHVTP